MGVAFNAGANVRDNAGKLNIGDIVRQSAGAALGTMTRNVSPALAAMPAVASGMQDFFHGLATGHALGQAAAAPQTTAKAQAKAPAGPKAPVYTQSFLDAQPNAIQQIAGAAAAAAAKGGDTSASTTAKGSPVDAAIARFAQASGGISLNELAALSHSMAETSPLRMEAKAPTSKDLAGANLLDIADKMYAMRQQQIEAEKDPTKKAAAMESAVKERADYLRSILGANPVDLQTAAAMGQGE